MFNFRSKLFKILKRLDNFLDYVIFNHIIVPAWKGMVMDEKAITFQRSEYSYDQASSDYMKTFVSRSFENWHGLAPFSIVLWVSYYSESGRRGRHWYYHKNYEYMALEMILDGNFFYEQDGVKKIANAGDIYMIHPGSDVRISNGESFYRRKLVVLITGSLLSPLLKSMNLEDCRRVTPEDPAWFEMRLRKIGDFLKVKDLDSVAEVSILAYELIAGLAKEHNRSCLQELPPHLREVARPCPKRY